MGNVDMKVDQGQFSLRDVQPTAGSVCFSQKNSLQPTSLLYISEPGPSQFLFFVVTMPSPLQNIVEGSIKVFYPFPFISFNWSLNLIKVSYVVESLLLHLLH